MHFYKSNYLSILLLALLLVGCSTDKPSATSTDLPTTNPSSTVPVVLDETPSGAEIALLEESPQFTKKEIYQHMITRSLVSTGHNQRLKKAIAKAKKGEELTVAYIGGSITEGASASSGKSYAPLSYASFKALFGQPDTDTIHYVNAGMGGTSSALGIMRYQRDVLDRLEALPDIVFIEFAVNDWQEPTNGRAYESLIHTILRAENEPAVVLVFSVFQSRWNLQEDYIPIGEAYGLPMISIRDAVVPAIDDDKTLLEDLFFADPYHPTTYGHKIMTDCITHLFETIDQAPTYTAPFELPSTPVVGRDFVGLKMIDSTTTDPSITIQAGGFASVDEALVALANLDGNKTFPNNWYHSPEDSNAPFIFTATCSNVLLAYKESSKETAGSVAIYIDGVYSQTIDSYSQSGWNNPVPILLLDEATPAEHTIEIRMAEGSENKAFSILALGITATETPESFDTPAAYDQVQSGVSYGALEQINYFSTTTQTTRQANVLLPADYTPSKTYPVLYLLHGIGGDQHEWLYGNPDKILGNLIATDEAEEMIVVMPNVRTRANDLANPSDIFTLSHFQAFDNFINDLRDNLMPYMAANYPIKSGREHTAIAGLSMGGRESLYIGFTMPETFGYIGAFCPAIGVFPYTNINISEPGLFTEDTFRLPTDLDTLVMIVKGANDGVVGIEPTRYHNALVTNAVDHIYYEIPGGHDFSVWSPGLYHFAKRLFK